MENEAFGWRVLGPLYLDLSFVLQQSGDTRKPEEVIALAVKSWLAERRGNPASRGYQWKELFLPHGTELRMRYLGIDYYAKVENDKIMYAGEIVTPRDWCLMVTGTVRNAWRDIWIRRSVNECWTHAALWRTASKVRPVLPYADRRQRQRRTTDYC
ncbi:hypothetical protein [Pseudoduganella sp. UC29_71]|uniref:hypothetical protein n=1 Tax=Pseudoduganella sp. UC29_71 TaxID=3350174 RepID=UPI00366C3B54